MKLHEPVLFRDGGPVSRIDLSGNGDPGSVIAAHTGHFALHQVASDGSDLLVRDLLGVHKLFFALVDGRIEASNFMIDLLNAGCPFSSIYSVPSGHFVRVHHAERRYELARWGQLRFRGPTDESAPSRELQPLATRIRAALRLAFGALAERSAGRPVYVTLSGGLDSTTIAATAREHIADLRAVTFALRDPKNAGPGSDFHYARRVAADLGIPHHAVLVEPEETLELLDDVLTYGQDYRDFNVHCGLVNAAMGRALGAWHAEGPAPLVLSGDTLNELLADYAPVELGGRAYFPLPRLERGALRRFLVGGLDSGDREVGILARYGVEAIQPHALCAQEYAALPPELACRRESKSNLIRAVIGERLPEYVFQRPKVRAQVATPGKPGGTLALLVERGIDQDYITNRFAELFRIDARAVPDITRAGHYRFSTTFPEPPTGQEQAPALRMA